MESFDVFDKESYWHGDHISKYNGQPYYYKNFFNEEQIKLLKNEYKEFIKEFNYE